LLIYRFGRRGGFPVPGPIGSDAAIPAVQVTTGSARVDPNPILTAAGHGSLTALALTAMGRLPKVLLAISQKGDADAAPDSLV
jgi:hypothetical protein